MFRLATCVLEGRNVLLVEDDEHTVGAISASVSGAGGTVVGHAPTVEAAVEMIETISVDMILLHIRYVPGFHIPIRDIFRPKGIEVEFLACFDDWFEFAEENDGDAQAVGFG